LTKGGGEDERGGRGKRRTVSDGGFAVKRRGQGRWPQVSGGDRGRNWVRCWGKLHLPMHTEVGRRSYKKTGREEGRRVSG